MLEQGQVQTCVVYVTLGLILDKLTCFIFDVLLAIFETLYGGEVPKVGKKQMEGAKRIADYFVKTASLVFASSNVADDIKQVVLS